MQRGKELESESEIGALLAGLRRIAVLGIKPESQASKPAHYVPKALLEMGLEVVPVPVYEFGVEEILGRGIYRRVADVPPPPLDLVDVFRRPQDLAGHLPDLLAARPAAVWLQLGIRDEAFAAALVEAGFQVVQDRCLLVEWRRHRARSADSSPTP